TKGIYVNGGVPDLLYGTPGAADGIMIADLSDPNTFKFNEGTSMNAALLSTAHGAGDEVFDIAVYGIYAYLAAGADGVEVFNVSDYLHPTYVGDFFGGTNAATLDAARENDASTGSFSARTVECAGGQVMAGSIYNNVSNYLEIVELNVATPSVPSLVRQIDLGMGASTPSGIGFSGQLMFSADGTSGLHWYTLAASAPFLPAVTWTGAWDGSASPDATCSAFGTGHAYFGFSTTTPHVRIVDTSVPTAPVALGERSFISDGDIKVNGMVVSGNSLMLAQNKTFVVADLTNIRNPGYIGRATSTTKLMAVRAYGDRIFVGYEQTSLGEYAASESGVPNKTWSASCGGLVNDILYANGVAYVAMQNNYLKAYDVGSGTGATLLDEIALDGPGNGLAIWGDYLLVAAGTAGLYIIDASDPTNLQTVDIVDTSGTATRVVTSGGYAYVADGDAGLAVIDLSTPSAARVVGTRDTTGSLKDLALLGRYAVGADGTNGITLFDLNDPTYPIDTTFGGGETTAAGGNIVAVDARGTIAVAADLDGNIWLADVTAGTDPVIFGIKDLNVIHGSSVTVNDLTISGDKVYVNTIQGMFVLSLDVF
ncbi:MAG: hypothetical protein WCT14_20740, partial [Treponemataceae bacterium]